MSSEQVTAVNSGNWKTEVEQAKVPVVVDFWASWCGPCRMVSPIIDTLGKKHQSKIKVVKVNVDENEDLAMKFNIMSIPTIMLFNNGRLISSVIGAERLEKYEEFLRENRVPL
jgi:thioredoxin 1